MDDVARDAFYSERTADPLGIRGWEDLVRYIRAYLNQEIGRTVFYTGSYSRETMLIMSYLLAMNSGSVITLDSQPGLVCMTDQFIQMPYLQLGGQVSSLQTILSMLRRVRGSRWIGCVMYSPTGMTPLSLDHFPNWEESREVGRILLGVQRPPDDADTEEWAEFLGYCMRDEFFQDIQEILTALPDELYEQYYEALNFFLNK